MKVESDGIGSGKVESSAVKSEGMKIKERSREDGGLVESGVEKICTKEGRPGKIEDLESGGMENAKLESVGEENVVDSKKTSTQLDLPKGPCSEECRWKEDAFAVGVVDPCDIAVMAANAEKSVNDGELWQSQLLPRKPPRRTLPLVGIGLDSCVMKLPHDGLYLIQTTDFFYPLVDDPFIMGKITCANVLSDLYAMGVVNVDNMSMILGVSEKLSDTERQIVLPLIIRGFMELAAEAGTKVTGGETVVNPWMTIGGVASSICHLSEFIIPHSAKPGDALVLTKPIGTQVAVNAHQWVRSMPERWARVAHVVDEARVERAYRRAMASMARLNRTGAHLMHKHGARGATDVTGFGLLGHARNLAQEQREDVTFVIDMLPVIADMTAIANALGAGFGLMRGTSAETSGGLLVILDPEAAQSFCREIEELDGCPAWIVGRVEAGGGRTARFVDEPLIIEVPAISTEGKI